MYLRASLGVPENSAFMDVEKILKIVHVKNKFWKIQKSLILKIMYFRIFQNFFLRLYDF